MPIDTHDPSFLKLPIAERRKLLAEKGNSVIKEWFESETFTKDKLKEEKREEAKNRRMAIAKSSHLTMGQRVILRKEALAAEKARELHEEEQIRKLVAYEEKLEEDNVKDVE